VYFYLLRLFNFCLLFLHLCCATIYDGEIKGGEKRRRGQREGREEEGKGKRESGKVTERAKFCAVVIFS